MIRGTRFAGSAVSPCPKKIARRRPHAKFGLARRTTITVIMDMMVVCDKKDSFRSVSCIAVPKKIKKIARKVVTRTMARS